MHFNYQSEHKLLATYLLFQFTLLKTNKKSISTAFSLIIWCLKNWLFNANINLIIDCQDLVAALGAFYWMHECLHSFSNRKPPTFLQPYLEFLFLSVLWWNLTFPSLFFFFFFLAPKGDYIFHRQIQSCFIYYLVW